MLAVLGLHGGGLNVSDIRTRSRLSDSNANADLAGDERCDEAVA